MKKLIKILGRTTRVIFDFLIELIMLFTIIPIIPLIIAQLAIGTIC